MCVYVCIHMYFRMSWVCVCVFVCVCVCLSEWFCISVQILRVCVQVQLHLLASLYFGACVCQHMYTTTHTHKHTHPHTHTHARTHTHVCLHTYNTCNDMYTCVCVYACVYDWCILTYWCNVRLPVYNDQTKGFGLAHREKRQPREYVSKGLSPPVCRLSSVASALLSRLPRVGTPEMCVPQMCLRCASDVPQMCAWDVPEMCLRCGWDVCVRCILCAFWVRWGMQRGTGMQQVWNALPVAYGYATGMERERERER